MVRGRERANGAHGDITTRRLGWCARARRGGAALAARRQRDNSKRITCNAHTHAHSARVCATDALRACVTARR